MPPTTPLAVEIACLPEQIKGYGHVKERHLKAARPSGPTDAAVAHRRARPPGCLTFARGKRPERGSEAAMPPRQSGGIYACNGVRRDIQSKVIRPMTPSFRGRGVGP
jgi:hypothetical protein